MANKLPPEVLDFFRAHGAAGGKIGGSLGGKTSAERMTPEQRRERARKAGRAAAAARKAAREAAAAKEAEEWNMSHKGSKSTKPHPASGYDEWGEPTKEFMLNTVEGYVPAEFETDPLRQKLLAARRSAQTNRAPRASRKASASPSRKSRQKSGPSSPAPCPQD